MIYLLLFLALLAFLCRALRNAPVSYEDEAGFHYGKPITLKNRGLK